MTDRFHRQAADIDGKGLVACFDADIGKPFGRLAATADTQGSIAELTS
jgi:hypothetical protein